MFSIRCLSAFIIATFIATSVLSQSLFSIGNSLTFDALRNFDGSYDHTINCNQNLDRIFNNPDQTCLPQLTGARPWDEAFENENYDFVTVQPFAGTSLSQDVAAISEWMRLQPDATFIIHTGWTTPGSRESQYSAPLDPELLSYGPAYFDALIEELESAFPDRRIASTNVIGTLDDIASDIAAGIGPISSIGSLYRDSIHFNTTGQYIATQSFNLLTGTPLDESRFTSIDSETRAYLDTKVTANIAVPEPSTGGAALFVGLMISVRRRCFPRCS